MPTSRSNAKLVANQSLLSYLGKAAEFFFRGSGHMLRRCSKTYLRLGKLDFMTCLDQEVLGQLFDMLWYVNNCYSWWRSRRVHGVSRIFVLKPLIQKTLTRFAQFRSEDRDPNAAKCTRCQKCTNCWKLLVALFPCKFASWWYPIASADFPMIMILVHHSCHSW